MDRSTSDLYAGWTPRWPEGKQFAFTIFDDPDFQTAGSGKPVYDFLADLGFRTTKGIFPGVEATPTGDQAVTCKDPEHLEWVLSLRARGFEIGWHGASPGTSCRPQTAEGLERFRQLFGDWPETCAQHYETAENLYWGDRRLSSSPLRLVYNLATRWRNHNSYHGDDPRHRYYWGDLCRERIRYMRNFVYTDINTLKACPFMPYHDPLRPDVNLWYSSTNGPDLRRFVPAVSEENQDRLEAEGGACIMYTHFAYQFYENGRLNKDFQRLMERLGRKNGWFVPVATLLTYIARERGPMTLRPGQRRHLERRWLIQKMRFGTA